MALLDTACMDTVLTECNIIQFHVIIKITSLTGTEFDIKNLNFDVFHKWRSLFYLAIRVNESDGFAIVCHR